MKNIFKKNHIIITALAIMIVIAGYLSFTNDDTADKKGTLQTDATGSGDYEEFTALDGMDLVTETGTTGVTGDKTTDDKDDTVLDDADAADKAAETTGDDENDEAIDTNSALESDELGDISDEDILANAKDVTDNGELNLEEGVPGEAVLANAASQIDSSYFITNKFEREQLRAKIRSYYMDIINSKELSEEQKQTALDGMMEFTDIMAKEKKAEMKLEAKGFADSIVFMNDGAVDVVVNSESLTDQQLAIIESIVKDETGVSVENIDIDPVVFSE
ncbi:stage III sporulation protein AH [Anaerotaenia torta]|uniref:SpoIIIAH-like family protein n=1 Tax=Anaerotaenia torta TaxID=433293 RepID=UPI003D227623